MLQDRSIAAMRRDLERAWEVILELKEKLERLQEFRQRILEALGPLPPETDDEIVDLISRRFCGDH